MEAIRQKLRAFIMSNFLFTDDDAALANDDSFMERGIIDSTGILEVIEFIGDEFKVSVADDELVPENFDSVSALTAFITAKQGA